MLIGEYTHSLDTKKRLLVPNRLRSELSGKVIITRGLDQCLFLYKEEVWKQIAEKLNQLPIGQADTRNFVRLMLAGAVESEIDGQGRVLVPDYLKRYAELTSKVVLVGVYNRVEIWAKDKWESVKAKTETDAGRLAERLGELGAY